MAAPGHFSEAEMSGGRFKVTFVYNPVREIMAAPGHFSEAEMSGGRSKVAFVYNPVGRLWQPRAISAKLK